MTGSTALPARGAFARSWAEHLGGTRFRFHHPCGHVSEQDLGSKRLPVAKRLTECGARLMARWWSKEAGGVHTPCPKGCPEGRGTQVTR